MIFTPLPEHNEGKIYCTYEQYNMDGDLLYENNEQHEQLIVNYILEPFEDIKNLGEAQVIKIFFKKFSQNLYFVLWLGCY